MGADEVLRALLMYVLLPVWLAAGFAERETAATELAGRRLLHPAAEVVDHQLHAVTDPEDRDAELEQLLPKSRRPVGVNGGRPSRKHQAPGSPVLDLLQRGVVGQQLAEHAALANAPRDQLRVLATEVQDEYLLQLPARRSWRRGALPRGGAGGVHRW